MVWWCGGVVWCGVVGGDISSSLGVPSSASLWEAHTSTHTHTYRYTQLHSYYDKKTTHTQPMSHAGLRSCDAHLVSLTAVSVPAVVLAPHIRARPDPTVPSPP